VTSVAPMVTDSPVQIIPLDSMIGGRNRPGRESRLYGPEVGAVRGKNSSNSFLKSKKLKIKQ